VTGDDLLNGHQRELLLSQLDATRRAAHERAAPFAALSRRERAVLAGLVAGETAEMIADRSYVSLSTVRTQIRAVLNKLGVKSQLAAVALARKSQWPEAVNDAAAADDLWA
jgi:DNA-binding NarL/FixJ family response regulator